MTRALGKYLQAYCTVNKLRMLAVERGNTQLEDDALDVLDILYWMLSKEEIEYLNQENDR